ncbi:efflux RND transporter periplasmic adaptor subunit [Pelagibacterium luteolum]|nr:efflux RND transporter periplasmic adaptor subunit [Pelagibacterium luteolum]
MSAVVRLALAIAILAGTVYLVSGWIAERPEAPQRMNRERTFTVEVMEPNYGTYTSPISAYGQVAAARTIDIRALVAGRVMEVSPNLAVGNTVEQGEVLVRLDPFVYDAAVLEARAAIADAELSLSEAQEAYALEERSIAASESALASARTDFERAQSLLSSGAATQQTVDTRALTVSEREQALLQSQSSLVTLNAQILRQRAAIEQARYALETAQRDLGNTEITAPFTGVVTTRNLIEGTYMSANEVALSLYDSAALEVSFNVSDRDYAILRREGLIGRGLEVSRTTGAAAMVPGTVARTAPEVDATTGGVTLYGNLDESAVDQLRPGTFVSVAIEGVAHDNTLLVPETAIYDGDHIYVIREGRMAAVQIEILDREGDRVIVAAEVPEGEPIITSRISQAGAGVAVVVEGAEQEAGGPPMGGGMRGPGG